MHALAELPDTVVIDDPDAEMHIHLDDGRWHREICGGSSVACGGTVNLRLRQLRRQSILTGSLCQDGCFSSFELALAAQHNQKERP
jgi:hypothetical protein